MCKADDKVSGTVADKEDGKGGGEANIEYQHDSDRWQKNTSKRFAPGSGFALSADPPCSREGIVL